MSPPETVGGRYSVRDGTTVVVTGATVVVGAAVVAGAAVLVEY